MATLLGCGGGGGAATSPTLPPLSSVFSSSYGYTQSFSGEPQIKVSTLIHQALSASDTDMRNTLVFGDFFREGVGSFSAFVMVNQSSGLSKPYFFKRINGVWTDKTTDILSDRAGCTTAAYAITADFNGDGRHDIFVACKGALSGGQWQREAQLLYLSTDDANGTYTKINLHASNGVDFIYAGFQATAADVNDDGAMDLVLATGESSPVFLMGRAASPKTNIDFTLDTTRTVVSNIGMPTLIHSVKLIPRSGTSRFDLVISGGASNQGQSIVWISGSTDTALTPRPGTFFYLNSSNAKAFSITGLEAVDALYSSGKLLLNMQTADRSTMEIWSYAETGGATNALLMPSYSDKTSAKLFMSSAGKLLVYDGDCELQSTAQNTSRCSLLVTP